MYLYDWLFVCDALTVAMPASQDRRYNSIRLVSSSLSSNPACARAHNYARAFTY